MRYRDAGVDISSLDRMKERIKNLVAGTFNTNVVTGIGLFGGLYQIGDKILVSSTDGVGTKLKVAQLARRHTSVGEDIVNHCINDILTLGAEPLFFLDYIAYTTIDDRVLGEILEGLANACLKVKLPLIGGETAQLPGYFQPGDYDLVGFITGIVDRAKLITGDGIRPNDRLIGLPSSGLHTNGYSLVRKIFFEVNHYPIDHRFPELDLPLGEELLIPHRCYLREVRKIRGYARGIIHITGGGFYGNIPRILPDGLGVKIDKRSWSPPPIFNLIRKLGDVSEEEMYRTFNMGIGMIIVVSPDDEEAVIGQIGGIAIGSVVEGEGVVIE